jgi:hypothetical protein
MHAVCQAYGVVKWKRKQGLDGWQKVWLGLRLTVYGLECPEMDKIWGDIDF